MRGGLLISCLPTKQSLKNGIASLKAKSDARNDTWGSVLLRKRLSILFLIPLLCFSPRVFAAPPPTAQQASGQQALSEQQERERKLREKIEKPLPKVENPAVPENQQPPVVGNQKALINKIVVSVNTILSESVINSIVQPFEGKELTLTDMQKVADLITDAFRKKGFITTRAIIPPQKVVNNTLELKIVVGWMGNMDVRGNHYFKTFLFTRRVTLKKGEPFNYNKLRSDLFNINQYPDRNVKATITPGQEPGQTDVLFDVKDHLPIHVSFSYDNFGSKFLSKNRFLGTATDNNLLGLDDILTFQYQISEKYNAYKLESLRYLVPVTNNTQVGFYSTRNQVELQGQFKATKARGKSDIYGVFVNQTLYNQPDLKIVADLGFDYKNVFNFLSGVESSRDLERVFKTGFNVDYTDNFYGRNIFSDQLSFGIPDIMGGLRAVDSRSSVLGAGGKFTKDVVDYLRLQTLPFDSTLLIKSEAQFASRTLDATEEYQLGGIANVRGFAPGEAVGDNGQSATAELGIPVYGIPKNLKIPFSSAKLYDALRVAAFYDWGHVHLRTSQPGVFKSRILDSYGCGLRVTLPENFFFRVDFAWPVTGQPSDHRGEHTWVQVTKQF